MAEATHALYDVDPVAITICKKGANRQRIFLKKTADDAELFVSPAEHRILKADDADWSVFYCVVAEPGALEDPGQGDNDGVVDVWKSEDEIRAAAHRFAKNRGYVNAVHDGFAEEGCTVVENAVALADFTVGPTTIKKGSWYLAVEPSDDFKAKVDAGDITGVSMEGTGMREALAKDAIDSAAAAPGMLAPSQGLTRKVKRLRSNGKTHKEIADHLSMTTSEVRGHLAKELTAEDEAAETRGILRKLAERVGLAGDDDLAAELRKFDSPTFGDLMTSSQLYDQLPDAVWALQSSIYRACTDDDSDDSSDTPDDAAATVAASCDQFKTWVVGLVTTLTGDGPEAIQKALGDEPGTLDRKTPEEDFDVDTNERIEKLEKSTGELGTKLDQLITGLQPVIDRVKEPEAQSPAELQKSLGDFVESTNETLDQLRKSIDALAEGNSSQAEAVKKNGAESKSDHPLAGIFD